MIGQRTAIIGTTMSVRDLPASLSNAMISQNTSPSNSLDEVIGVEDLEICGDDATMRCVHLSIRDMCVMRQPPCNQKKIMFIHRRDLPKYIAIRLTR